MVKVLSKGQVENQVYRIMFRFITKLDMEDELIRL